MGARTSDQVADVLIPGMRQVDFYITFPDIDVTRASVSDESSGLRRHHV